MLRDVLGLDTVCNHDPRQQPGVFAFWGHVRLLTKWCQVPKPELPHLSDDRDATVRGQPSPPEVAELWKLVQSFGVESYGDHVVPIPYWLPDKERVAVFPGGSGTRERAFPTGGIIVVCNDFDNQANFFDPANANGYPWSGSQPPEHVQKMLKDVGRPDISSRTWFTNFALGLKKTQTNRGLTPGWKHEPFRAMCAAVFLRTLEVAQPRLIITLGAHVPDTYLRSVCTVPDRLKWSDRVHEIKFVNGFACHVISNVHPDRSWMNYSRHRYNGLVGRDAELALLKTALKAAGF